MKPLACFGGICVLIGIVLGMLISSEPSIWSFSAATAQPNLAAAPQARWQPDVVPPAPMTSEEQTNVFVYENTNPSVANISTVSIHQTLYADRRSWEQPGLRPYSVSS